MSIRVKYYLSAVLRLTVTAAIAAGVLYNLLHDELALNSDYLYEFSANESSVQLPVNINSASIYELQKINGVGKVKAAAIVAYREEHGGFASVDELINVKGIGEITLEKIRGQITV